MNWRRIKTFAKFLVFGSLLLPFFYANFQMNVWDQYLEEGRTLDSLRTEATSEIEALFLLSNCLVPVMFFGVVLWIIAAKKLRRHTVNPRSEINVDS